MVRWLHGSSCGWRATVLVMLWLLLAALLTQLGSCAPFTDGDLEADVVVFSATPSAVVAAVTAARLGLSVVIIQPTPHFGGMLSGGLSCSDTGNASVIGGITREVFQHIGKAYGQQYPAYKFEPHVAGDVLWRMVANETQRISVLEGALVNVTKIGASISSVTILRGGSSSSSSPMSTLVTVHGKVFIDASYEGDLLALAGVSFVVGREGRDVYGERFAGIRSEPDPLCPPEVQFHTPIDPYNEQGVLLPLMSPPIGTPGDGDNQIQSYNYRLCMTNESDNMVPITLPKGYNASTFELLRRWVQSKGSNLSLDEVLAIHPTVNGKTDVNDRGPIGTDYLGAARYYPEGNRTVRNQIIEDHVLYTKGLLYFWGHDSSVPSVVRDQMIQWGLCKDEFTNTNNWPPQLYVREARRMKGTYVFTQFDRENNRTKSDSIAMGSYGLDVHNARRIPSSDGKWAYNEGNVNTNVRADWFLLPFEIPYRILLPSRNDATNLLVTVALSSSHVAYGCLRLEPQLMMIGQAAATAAYLSLSQGGQKTTVPVQDVPVDRLQQILRQHGQILHETEEVPDDGSTHC